MDVCVCICIYNMDNIKTPKKKPPKPNSKHITNFSMQIIDNFHGDMR